MSAKRVYAQCRVWLAGVTNLFSTKKGISPMLKIKAIAVVMGMMGIAQCASATILGSQPGSGNGSFLFVAADDNYNSWIQGINFTLNDSTGTTEQTFSLGNVSSFFNGSSNAVWGIIAADATGAGGTYNGYRMAYSLSTTLTAQDIADAGTGSNFASVKSAALTFETWLNSAEDGTRVVNAPLTSTSDADAWNLYNGDAIGRDIAGQGQYFVTDLVDGSEMTNWIFDNGLIDGRFFRESTYTAQSNWRLNLNTNQLVYAPAPVPVPAALWLLGSALVGVAGVRRRA